MNGICALLGVTYGEFQALLDQGEVRILPQRLTFLEKEFDDQPSTRSLHIGQVLDKFPNLPLDDMGGLLIVQIDVDSDLMLMAACGASFWLPVSKVRHVFPLIKGAGEILQDRLNTVDLGEPILERSVKMAWEEWRWRDSRRAGDALVSVFFENPIR